MMLEPLFDAGFPGARASLWWALGLSAMPLLGMAQTWWRWTRYKNGPSRTAARPYRGWFIAFAIVFACVQLSLGTYWLRLGLGEVVQAEVREISQTRVKGRGAEHVVYRVVAMSENAAGWPLEEEGLQGDLAEALKAELRKSDGSVRVPFLVVSAWPSVHQLGTRARLHRAVLVMATLALIVFVMVYGYELPKLAPSHGRYFEVFFDGAASLAGAAWDQLAELGAIVSFALIMASRLRGDPFTWQEPAFAVLLGVCIWRLLKHIVDPQPRTLGLRTGNVAIPTSSVFHFIFDAAWIAAGIALIQPPRSDAGLAFATALIAIPGLLVIARLMGWRNRV